ncbi:MAG: phospholipid carrier-dependent glycosyltransferase [Gammaproteobacteria bacterium]|nr:phospholipid carrier-dependent glycosyltransferase [Gammaproteobacteria bacterium]
MAIALHSNVAGGNPAAWDASQFLAAAYHLHHHGVFSESRKPAVPRPGIGREPGYGVFLAGLMTVSADLRNFDFNCLANAPDCRSGEFLAVQWANSVLLALTGLLMFLTLRLLAGSPIAAWVAALHVWLNFEAAASRQYAISDYLALLLVAAVTLSVIWAYRAQRASAWAVPGLAMACLTLTKGVFLYLFGLVVTAACIFVVFVPRLRRITAIPLLVFVVTFSLPVGGWMARNHAVAGEFALSAGRTGIVLNNRAVLNEMGPGQYAAAFVYWTRGWGDSVARRFLAPETWQPFDLAQPGGYYDRGQNGFRPRVRRLMKSTGLDFKTASGLVEKELRHSMMRTPLKHLAVAAPLFYRGVWIDEFIVFSLPALAWLLVRSIRRRSPVILLALLPSVFNLIFYPLVSMNIPRYQLTALPGLALASGIAVEALAQRWWRWRSAAGTP